MKPFQKQSDIFASVCLVLSDTVICFLQDGGLHSFPGDLVLLPVVRSSFQWQPVHLVPRLLLPLPNPHHREYARSVRTVCV